MTFTVNWIDAGREPLGSPDPRYPNGIDVDLTTIMPPLSLTCSLPLPYPAASRRCGYYIVACDICKTRVVLTTAGRRDDPRSVTVSCKPRP